MLFLSPLLLFVLVLSIFSFTTVFAAPLSSFRNLAGRAGGQELHSSYLSSSATDSIALVPVPTATRGEKRRPVDRWSWMEYAAESSSPTNFVRDIAQRKRAFREKSFSSSGEILASGNAFKEHNVNVAAWPAAF